MASCCSSASFDNINSIGSLEKDIFFQLVQLLSSMFSF